MSIGVSGVIHLIGYILGCRWIPSFSGSDSVSRGHFRSESFQRFIYYKKIPHFVLVSGDC